MAFSFYIKSICSIVTYLAGAFHFRQAFHVYIYLSSWRLNIFLERTKFLLLAFNLSISFDRRGTYLVCNKIMSSAGRSSTRQGQAGSV